MREFYIRHGVLKKYKGSGGDVTVPGSVTRIGDSAFLDCDGLESVVLPDSVVSIGKYAFSGCGDLRSVTFPRNLKSIGEWAFEACGSLEGVSLPDSVDEVGDYAFSDCRSLADVDGFVILGGVLFDYYGSAPDVSVPEGVSAIGSGAFYCCGSLKSVTVPEGVTSIGYGAFQGCRALKSVTLPGSITQIGGWAFYDCGNLKSVTVPGGVTVIGGSTFQGCGSLEEISLPRGVTEIGDSAFKDCRSLTRIDLPDCVKSIGDIAFKGCRSLKSIAIPRGVGAVGGWVFAGCGGLESVSLPEGLGSIGDSAFLDCTALTGAEVPESVNHIGSAAFRGCRSLGSLRLPRELTDIGPMAFSGCKGLADENGFVVVRGTLYGYCGKDRDAAVPDTVKAIAGGAFRDSPSVLDITLPESVEAVADTAFYKASVSIRVKRWFQDLTEAVKTCRVRAVFTEEPRLLPARLRRAGAIGFALDNGTDRTSEAAKLQLSYLTRNASRLRGEAFRTPEVLRFLCANRLIRPIDVDAYIQQAQTYGDEVLTAMVLEYQNRIGFDVVNEARERREQRLWDFADLRDERAAAREADGDIAGLCFAVSGHLDRWRSHGEVRAYLAKHGARLGFGVTLRTDYLVTADPEADTEKHRAAAELGVPEIDEEEFDRMVCRFYEDAGSIEVPPWVKVILRGAFSGAVSAVTVTVPGSVEEIEEGAFPDSPGFTLRASAGSRAQRYAEEHGIPFEAE